MGKPKAQKRLMSDIVQRTIHRSPCVTKLQNGSTVWMIGLGMFTGEWEFWKGSTLFLDIYKKKNFAHGIQSLVCQKIFRKNWNWINFAEAMQYSIS